MLLLIANMKLFHSIVCCKFMAKFLSLLSALGIISDDISNNSTAIAFLRHCCVLGRLRMRFCCVSFDSFGKIYSAFNDPGMPGRFHVTHEIGLAFH
jgi:hypothetical protein